MDKSTVSSGVAALNDGDEWVLDPVQKANLLERTFAWKCTLPLLETNKYSNIGQPHFTGGFLRIRVRDVLRVLRNLKEHNATGPDQGVAATVAREADSRNSSVASTMDIPLDYCFA